MRQYTNTSVQILEWEENAIAVKTAVSAIKGHLVSIPDLPAVWRDVLARCNTDTHADLIQWINECIENEATTGRLPKAHSPDHSLSIWMLYNAADLECSPNPPDPIVAADIGKSVARTALSVTAFAGLAFGGSLFLGLI